MKKQIKSGPDVVGLLTRIQEQLAGLDRKVDSLVQRSLTQPSVTRPVQVPGPAQGSGRPNNQHPERQMHRAVCSDCKKECELPFKPSGDRPVYCKECFSRRKVSNAVKPVPDRASAGQSLPLVVSAAIDIPKHVVQEKKRSSAVKKPAGKKAVIPKKKKK